MCLFASEFKVFVNICVYLEVFLRFVLQFLFFSSGLVVCVEGYLCETINEISRLRRRTIIIGYRYFRLSLLFFLCTMKTIIIKYELNNITIQINLATSYKINVRLVHQQLVEL